MEELAPEAVRLAAGLGTARDMTFRSHGRVVGAFANGSVEIAVTNVDTVAAALEAAGRELTWDTTIPGVRRVHTSDPVGNRVEFQQI